MYIIMSTTPLSMEERNEKEEKVTGEDIEKEALKPITKAKSLVQGEDNLFCDIYYTSVKFSSFQIFSLLCVLAITMAKYDVSDDCRCTKMIPDHIVDDI
jgi:hypothetical protein